MRIMKKISLGIIALLSLGTFVACKEENTVEPIEPFDPTPVTSSETLSSITLDTTNAKTDFYIGESFTSEGLVVTANFVKYENGRPTSVPKECKDYYVDTSLLDMNHSGVYPVTVVYRLATTKVQNKYNVTVKSSVLEASSVKYVSGLEIKYSAQTSFLVDDEFQFRTNALTIRAHYFEGSSEVETKALAYTKITIDSSSVDTTKVGTYLIKYTFTEDLTLDGTPYKNEVCAFTVVTVTNPALSISLVSGTTDLEASIFGVDTSDWKIRIVRAKRAPEIVDFSEELFTLKNVVPYLVATQTAKVELNENPLSVFMEFDVTIKESDKYSIITAVELDRVAEENDKIQLDETGKLFVPKNVTMTTNRHTDRFGGILFKERVTIKGASQPLEVIMDAPGILVIYIASSGDEAREITVYDPDGEEIDTYTTSSTKQVITEVRLNLEKAGTYKVINPASGVYIHGCIIATEKVAK